MGDKIPQLLAVVGDSLLPSTSPSLLAYFKTSCARSSLDDLFLLSASGTQIIATLADRSSGSRSIWPAAISLLVLFSTSKAYSSRDNNNNVLYSYFVQYSVVQSLREYCC